MRPNPADRAVCSVAAAHHHQGEAQESAGQRQLLGRLSFLLGAAARRTTMMGRRASDTAVSRAASIRHRLSLQSLSALYGIPTNVATHCRVSVRDTEPRAVFPPRSTGARVSRACARARVRSSGLPYLTSCRGQASRSNRSAGDGGSAARRCTGGGGSSAGRGVAPGLTRPSAFCPCPSRPAAAASCTTLAASRSTSRGYRYTSRPGRTSRMSQRWSRRFGRDADIAIERPRVPRR